MITSYINDLLIFRSNIKEIDSLRTTISIKVEISDLHDISYYLGIEVSRNRANRTMIIS